jgi:hypothetical protein
VASFYVVVQYVPRPIAEERINVGVLAFAAEGDPTIHRRFLADWRRVEAFGDGEIGFLRDFARDFDARGWTPDLIRRASREWAGCIQLTAPRASTLPAAELLDRIARDMLVEPAAVVR